MIAFIDDHRGELGVEPICRHLPIARSTYYGKLAKRTDPGRVADRPYGMPNCVPRYGVSLRPISVSTACARFGTKCDAKGSASPGARSGRMKKNMGLEGAIRGKTIKDHASRQGQPCPLDRVNRQFRVPAPDVLWISDFTHVATWQGFIYVAFVVDAYARRIVGWRVSRTAHAGFVLDALEQAAHQRRPEAGLVHHSDRGSQYLSIRYTECLAEAGIVPSVGSVGDSYDNALAETIHGLFKTEVVHRRGPWRSFDAVKHPTLEWVDWFNNRRLLEPIGNIPPAQAKANFYATLETADMAA